jgi:hypothetical protein
MKYPDFAPSTTINEAQHIPAITQYTIPVIENEHKYIPHVDYYHITTIDATQSDDIRDSTIPNGRHRSDWCNYRMDLHYHHHPQSTKHNIVITDMAPNYDLSW